MSLRDRQIGGIPLEWGAAIILTILLALCIPIIGYTVWFPLFGISDELKPWLSFAGVILYISQCAGRVPQGLERAQLFFGMYTGVSFPAGLYLLPRLPFPFISLLLLLVKDDVSKYLGWVLEGDVKVESIVISFYAEGLASDGIRVSLKGKLVFEITNAAIFLSQNGDGTARTEVREALEADTATRIKQRVIAEHTAKNLYQGKYEGGSSLTRWVTEACSFAEDFGLRLSRAPVVTVTIENERIRNAFDADNAKGLLRDVSNETAEAYAEFVKRLPKGTSEEVALAFFNTARMHEGLPPVSINMVKFK